MTDLQILVVTVVIPLTCLQFFLALFALTRLAYCKYSTKKYVCYNIFVVLVFFIGPIAFLFFRREDIRQGKKTVVDKDKKE